VYFSTESGSSIQGTAIILERPLLAESGPCYHPISADLNGRFREKRTSSPIEQFLPYTENPSPTSSLGINQISILQSHLCDSELYVKQVFMV